MSLPLSNTSKLKQIEVKTKKCSFCTGVDVLQLTLCVNACHADSEKEQRKVAHKARSSLETSLDKVLIPALTYRHQDLMHVVADAAVRTMKLEDSLQGIGQSYLSFKGKLASHSHSREDNATELMDRLTRLNQRLDRVDEQLALAASEGYDQEEQVKALCSGEFLDVKSLQVVKTETKTLKTEVLRLPTGLSQCELDIGVLKILITNKSRDSKQVTRSEKLQKELDFQRKDILRINESLIRKIKDCERQLSALLLEPKRTLIDTMTKEIATLKQEQPAILGISPASLIAITAQVFGPYKRINMFKRETQAKMETLKVQLGTLKRR